jgi:hypothetical protein
MPKKAQTTTKRRVKVKDLKSKKPTTITAKAAKTVRGGYLKKHIGNVKYSG